jgi:hypothetical protein
MKTLLSSRGVGASLAVVITIALAQFTVGAEKKEAHVSIVIRDVRLLASKVAPRPASVNDSVHEGTGVRTGSDSRAELTFTDQTLTRLGANTVFSFGGGARSLDLGSGAMLLSAPKSSGSMRINTEVVTVGVTGFTAMFESHPHSWCKFLVLEGHGSIALRRRPGEKRELRAGQIIIFAWDAQRLPDVRNVDLSKLIKTARLITQFPKLPNWDLILQEVTNQQNSPQPGGGYVDPTNVDGLDQQAGKAPAPTPRQRLPGNPSDALRN